MAGHSTWTEAAEFDAAIKAGRLPRDAPGRRAAVTFGTVAARWLATKQATKRPRTADLYATELRSHVLPAFSSVPLPDITRREVQESTLWPPPGWRRPPSATPTVRCSRRC
jgi:Phage integrase, N-terminal SAM-like domain